MTARRHRSFHALVTAAHALQKQADRLISDRVDLTTAQAAVLTAIESGEAHTQAEIAEALGQNESALTAMVARLERKGWLEKTRSSTDRRVWTLRVTQTGSRVLSEAREAFKPVNTLIDGVIGLEDVGTFTQKLKRLRAAASAA